MEGNILDYVQDLVYGATQFPCGIVKPQVYRGYFVPTVKGELQRVFFHELLRIGFERTIWQLVFPGQTAGIIRKIEPTPEGIDEHHVRFYDDGAIVCESEVGRFHRDHWSGPRQHSSEPLERILVHESILHPDQKDAIRKLFGKKDFSERCVRR